MSSIFRCGAVIGRGIRPLRLCVLLAASIAVSCYTLRVMDDKEKLSRAESATKQLHAIAFQYAQETFYAYPQVATRVGVHRHKLANDEVVRLDRELPNFSEDLVAARVESLNAFLARLDKEAPAEALSANDRADRRLVVDSIRLELAQWEDRQEHTSNPLFHVAALAEALYYPLVLDYAPEEDRLSDVLARLQWVPSYVDRAMRMTRTGSEAQFTAAAAVNRFITEIVKTELDARIGEDAALKESFGGMKGSVLDSLGKLQGFLDGGGAAKEKRTFRLGAERYRDHVALLWHGAADPGAAGERARARIDELKKEMYEIAKPVYCQENETDRKTCGPTKAEIAAAKKAEEDKARREEEAAKKAEEKQQRDEAAAAKKAEAQEQREEAAAAKKAEEEKRREEEAAAKKAAEEKAKKAEDGKKGKDITNPYEDKPAPKEEPKNKSGIDNPYGALIGPSATTTAGAKQADAKPTGKADKKLERKADKKEAGKAEEKAGEKAEEKAEEKEEKPAEEKAAEKPGAGSGAARSSDEAMMDKVIGFVLGQIAAAKPAGPGPEQRLAQAVDSARGHAEKIGFSEPPAAAVAVAPMPAMLAATYNVFALSPVPPFEPKQGARLFVSRDAPTAPLADLSREWMEVVAAEWASPGMGDVLARAAEIEPQTRRAVRAVFGDVAFVEGFGLYAAIAIADGADGDDGWRGDLVAKALELEAAAEVLVDIGLHSEGMSEADAVALLTRDAYCDAAYAENRIAFAKLYPGALATRFVGLVGWRAVREEAAASAKLDDAGFVKAALAAGPVALADLPAVLGADANAAPDVADAPVDPAEAEPKFTFMGAE